MPAQSRWRSKPPPGVTIDWTHPFTQGLRWFAPLNEDTGGTITDYGPVGLDLAVQANTLWSTSGSEPALAMAGTSQGAGANLPAQMRLTWPITLVFKIRQTASISSSTVIFGILATNNNTTPFRVATVAWRTSNPNRLSLDWNFAGTNTIVTNLFQPVIGRDYVVAAEFTGSSQKLFVDGIRVYSGTATGGNPTYGTVPLLQCGPSPTGPTPTANCLMYWGGIWDQAFDDNWHQRIADNPWPVFLSPRSFSFLKSRLILVADAGSFIETGIAANLKAGRKVAASAGSFVEAGIAAGLYRGYPLVATKGTFTETGVAASLRTTRVVTATAGTFAETGIAAGLRATRLIAAATGSFAEAGIAAGLYRSFPFTAAAGSFVEVGRAANLSRGRTVTAAAGSFAETGIAAGLRATRIIVAAGGTFAESGQIAGLIYEPVGHFALASGTGSFAETGVAANLLSARVVVAGAGSFAETGIAAGFSVVHRITAAAGSFVLAGQPAALISSAVHALVTEAGVFVEAGGVAGLSRVRSLFAATGVFRLPTTLITTQVFPTSLPIQTSPVYATDEDIAVRAGGDFTVLAPTSQQMASANDGIFEPGSPWVLTSPSINFEDYGVSPNQVVHFTEPRTVFKGSGNILAVENVSGNAITLRRLHKPLHVGQPPAPIAGVTGVTYHINTLDPQIEEATFDIKRRFGIDENVAMRGSSWLYDLRDLRMATVLQVMLNRYTQESRTEHGDFDRKVERIRAELASLEDRMQIRWGVLGDFSAPSSVFGTRILRG